MTESFEPRPATSGDLEAIRALLAAEGLPTDGVAEAIEHFRVLDNGEGVVAAAGIELYGDCALLRSLVVAPELRGRGLADRLVEGMIAHARRLGAHVVYLLTTDADGYFAGRGFVRIPRADAPAEIHACREFRELCPDTATLMQREI